MLPMLTLQSSYMQAKAFQQDAVVSVLVQSGNGGSESAYGDGALIRLLTFQVPVITPQPLPHADQECADASSPG